MVKKMAVRTINVSPEMTQDAKTLIEILGCPIIEASGEAEAQCAHLCKMGLAYGTASEDLDTLTLGSPYLLRGFNSNKKEPVTQIELEKVLEGFEMSMEEFIDFCILCGCDYTGSIGGVGPVRAFSLIKETGSIEKVIEKIKHDNANPKKKRKFTVPDDFKYQESRALFKQPDVIRDKTLIESQLKWKDVDENELRHFLIDLKRFRPSRVEKTIQKMISLN